MIFNNRILITFLGIVLISGCGGGGSGGESKLEGGESSNSSFSLWVSDVTASRISSGESIDVDTSELFEEELSYKR